MTHITISYEQGETGDQIVATNSKLQVRWAKDAELILLDPSDPQTRVAGGPLIELAPSGAEKLARTVGLGLDDWDIFESQPEPLVDAHGKGFLLRRIFPVALQPLAVEWIVCLYDDRSLVRMLLTIRNRGTRPVTLRRVFPFVTGAWWSNDSLRLAGRERGFAAYKNGWQSWSFAGGLPEDIPDLRPRERNMVVWHSPGGRDPSQPVEGVVDVVSESVGMIGRAEQREALLAGFLSADEWLGQVYVDRSGGALAACTLLDNFTLQPNETVTTPPVMLAVGTQQELLSEYAAAVAREQEVHAVRSSPSGWSSWYYYYPNISEEAVVENLAALRAVRHSLPIKLVQIDDGYQTAVGDWLSVDADKFPRGMGAMAHMIREAGYRPGLWIAPFTVQADSQLAHEHPDWLVRNRQAMPAYGGHNWNVDLYGLDTTHPEAQTWLRRLFATIVQDWGFDYLKLDFLVSAALEGTRYESTATRASALREGLALIREVVGNDVFLTGCGCPLLSAAGLLDAMRVGPDSAPYWPPYVGGLPRSVSDRHAAPNLAGAVRNTITRSWMHPALWINDPDCLIVREHHSELTLDEVIAFASAVGLSGGSVFVSDRISQLSLERLDIVSRLLPPMREHALPDNYFAAGIPERMRADIVRPWGHWVLLGLFNGSDAEREIPVRWGDLGLPRAEHHAAEFWSGTYLGTSSIGVSVRVPAHGAAVLAIRERRDEPQLLSTSFHISQGAVEIAEWEYDAEREIVEWKAQIERETLGTFMIWLPSHLRPMRLSSTSGMMTWQRMGSGELIITAEVRQEAVFTLELERL